MDKENVKIKEDNGNGRRCGSESKKKTKERTNVIWPNNLPPHQQRPNS